MRLSAVIFLLFYSEILLTKVNSSKCIGENIQDCRENLTGEECQCPCLPKCCPKGQILRANGNDHGVACVHGSDADLPKVPMEGELGKKSSQKPQKFYAGVFPSCEGLSGQNWNYTINSDFSVNADTEEEYILSINEGKKVSSNFDNEGDRHFEKEKVAGLPYIKPLMYFCFDVMEGVEGVEKTIALTCPHKSLTTATALAKCCPIGQIPRGEECVKKQAENWLIPINGHLIDSNQLLKENLLVYEPGKRSEVFSTSHCKDWTSFHLGPDGLLHYIHDFITKDKSEFCVDSYEEQEGQYNPGDYNYNYPEDGSGSGDYEDDDEHSDQNSEPDPDCHKVVDKVPMTALYYCSTELEILKCCPKGENINVVNASCTNQLGLDDFMKRVEPTIISEYNSLNMRMDDYRMAAMNKTMLTVSNDQNLKLNFTKNGGLFYKGRTFSKKSYCLDYEIEFCDKEQKIPKDLKLRAVIHDEDLYDQALNSASDMTSLYGSPKNENTKINTAKNCEN